MMDIHSHILPGIDDGANSIEETIMIVWRHSPVLKKSSEIRRFTKSW